MLVTTVGEKFKFKNIVFEDSIYYGIKKKTQMNDEKRFGLFLGVVGVAAWLVGIILVLTVFGFGG